MATSTLTYNGLVKILQDIATRHFMIDTFLIGRNDEIGQSKDVVYPMLQIYPTNATMPINDGGFFKTIEIDLNMKVVNLVQSSEDNEKDVISDCLQCLQDVINELNTHPYYINRRVKIIGDINFTELEEFEDDFTAGWECDITFQFVNHNKYCGLPIQSIPGFETISNDCPTVLVKNSDGSYLTTVTAGSTLNLSDITVTTGSGNQTFPSAVDISLSAFTSGNTIPINTANLYKTGQETSYRPGDDGDLQEGRGTDFDTLDYNNGFGNTNRFTDELGGQTYANDLVIDWAYWDQINDTVPMWYRVVADVAIAWYDAIDNAAASTQAGYSDWYLANRMEMLSIVWHEVVSSDYINLNYTPFNIDIDSYSNINEIWTATRGEANDRYFTQFPNGNNFQRPSAQAGVGYMMKRTATLSELGL